MHKFVILLIVACGMNCNGDSPNDDGYSTGILKAGIKKNEVGANGRNQVSNNVSNNLRNPVFERLFRRSVHPGEPKNPPEIVERKIRQIQPPTVAIDRKEVSQVLILQPLNFIKSKRQSVRSLERTSGQNLKNMSQSTRKPFVPLAAPPPPPSENPFNYVITRSKGGIFEGVVNSQVLRVRGDPKEKDVESDDDEGDYQDGGFYHKVETYPATAIVINIFNRDGTLKSSVTHFRPNLPNFLAESATGRKQAYDATANHMIDRINFSGNYLGYPRAMPPSKFPFHTIRVPNSDLNVDSYSSTGLSNLRNNNKFNSFEPVVCIAASQAVKYGESMRTAREKPEIKKDVDGAGAGAGAGDGDVSRDRLDSKFERYYKIDDPLEDFTEKFDQKESEIRKGKRSKPYNGPLLLRRIIGEKHLRNVRDTTSVIMLKDSQGDRINVTVQQPSNTKIKSTNDLILRKGGIAIAGPGGAATAYTGGTAIVGPYGTVYKSPEGTAILGPFGKIVNITDDTDFLDIIKMHGGTEGKFHRIFQTRSEIPPSGFQTFKNLFSYITNRPVQVSVAPQKRKFVATEPNAHSRLKENQVKKAQIEEALDTKFREIVEDAPFDEIKGRNETFLIFRPKSKAEAGRNGIAVSAPVSHAILFPGHKTQIYFEPEAVASAGPSGFAHAHSDLFVSYASDGATSPQTLKSSF